MPPRSMSLPLPNSPSTRSRLVISLPVATGRPVGVELVLAQEHLVRGRRGVGLVLVDERRGLVEVLDGVVEALVDADRIGIVAHHAVGARPGVGRGARQHHEAQVRRQLVAGAGGAVRTQGNERIVRLQRDEHRAVAALLHQVEAVVEELAEEHEPQVEGGGQALIGRHVVERELGNIVLGAGDAVQTGRHLDDADALVQHIVDRAPDAVVAGTPSHRHGRRVVAGLVDDQVGDDARVGVDNGPAIRVGRSGVGI